MGIPKIPGVEVVREGEGEKIAAVIVRRGVLDGLDRTTMFTEEWMTLQAGYSIHRKGESVPAHYHPRPAGREGETRMEVLFVVRGRIRVRLYTLNGARIKTTELGEGDFIVLNCAHEVEFLEDTALFEVKEGPYPGRERDKVWIGRRGSE